MVWWLRIPNIHVLLYTACCGDGDIVTVLLCLINRKVGDRALFQPGGTISTPPPPLQVRAGVGIRVNSA